MKICPQCRKTYEDDNLNFCLDDGTALARADQGAPTMVMPPPRETAMPPGSAQTQWQQPAQVGQPQRKSSKTWLWVILIVILLLLLCGGGLGGIFFLGLSKKAAEGKNAAANIRAVIEKLSATPSPAGSSTPSKSGKSDQNITLENYKRLTTGMARSEVEKILGGKGSEISDTSGGGMRFTVVKWEAEDYDSIIITFKDEKIMTKTQVGLD